MATETNFAEKWDEIRRSRSPRSEEAELAMMRRGLKSVGDISIPVLSAEAELAMERANLIGEFMMLRFGEDPLNRIEQPDYRIPAPMPPAPVKSALHPTAAVDEEYIALAGELGVETPAILKTRLENFLAEHFMVYPIDPVIAYMNGLVEQERAKGVRVQWGWKPLRKRDRSAALSGSDNPFLRSVGGGISDAVYTKPVPYAALLTVKRISEAFGNAVKFFVTDYEAVKPDPFLMVTAEGLPFYVIERWDEPAFRT